MKLTLPQDKYKIQQKLNEIVIRSTFSNSIYEDAPPGQLNAAYTLTNPLFPSI